MTISFPSKNLDQKSLIIINLFSSKLTYQSPTSHNYWWDLLHFFFYFLLKDRDHSILKPLFIDFKYTSFTIPQNLHSPADPPIYQSVFLI